MEILKQVDSRYIVSKNGEIYSLFGSRGLRKKLKLLKTQDYNGYKRTTVFYDNGKRFTTGVHRIIGCCYLGLDLKDSKTCVHHINGIKNDNRIENLKVMKTGEHSKDILNEARNKEIHAFSEEQKKDEKYILSLVENMEANYQENMDEWVK